MCRRHYRRQRRSRNMEDARVSRVATTAAVTSAASRGGRSAPASAAASNAADDSDSGLEYHIKFPTSKYANVITTVGSKPPPEEERQQGAAGDDYVFVVDEHRLPVVLLFGWAGCQDKYLAKYSRIYEDRGLITLRYIVPIKYLLWKRYHVVRIGQKLVKLLYDLNFDGHPIIVHCFSNGGAFLYQNFSMALENCALADEKEQIQVKGVIFDSSPGRRRLLSLYKAISAILGGNIIYNTTMSFLFTFFCSMIWLWELAQKYVCGAQRDLVADPFDRLRTERHRWPQHFIYSEADDLISHKDVECFIRHRESIGVRVSALRYKSSPHVKHFSHHRESYQASVLAFVNECLHIDGDGNDQRRKRDDDELLGRGDGGGGDIVSRCSTN